MSTIDEHFELWKVAKKWVDDNEHEDRDKKISSLFSILFTMDRGIDKYIKSLKDSDIISRYLEINSVKGVIYGVNGDYEAWVVENKQMDNN